MSPRRTRSVRFSHLGMEDDLAAAVAPITVAVNDAAAAGVEPEPDGCMQPPRVMETSLIRSKSEPSVIANLV